VAHATASSAPSQIAAKSSPQQQTPSQVTINDGKKLTVPTFIGLPVRKVIETAAAAGLDVEIVGSGTVREQAPVPGTQVPIGTKIVVHCGR